MNVSPTSKVIFITHTIFQNQIVNLILKQYFGDKEHFKTLITSVSGFNKKGFDKIIEYDSNSLKGIRKLKEIKDYLETEYAGSQIFIPNIDGLLDNYCYLKSLQTGLENINFYFDGILFLYKHKHEISTRHYQRKIIAAAFGMKYQFRESIFPYSSSTINHIYTVLPEYTLCTDPNKVLPIILDEKEYLQKSNNRVVLLTADITEDKHNFFSKIIDKILESNPKAEIYFKHHPKETEIDAYETIAKSKGIIYKVIPKLEIIENIIDQAAPAKVIGYPSTALMTLKIIYGQNLNVECVFCKTMPNHMKRLSQAYHALKIETYEI